MVKASLMATVSKELSARDLQVSPETRKVPEIVNRLNDWQYIERTLHRLLAAWGRYQSSWDDKVALHRHVWDQAEVVRRLRERIAQFPGGKPDALVSPELEQLGKAALQAPDFENALDAIYGVLLQAMLRAYVAYTQAADPIHDAPTIAVLHEINTIKEQQYFWYREYRRRHPHQIDPRFRESLEAIIAELNGFTKAISFKGKAGARPCGAGSDFRPPKFSSRPENWHCEHDIMPYLRAEFSHSMEARRLFWAIGYMMEMNLPDDQLNWIYYGHYMPWEWHHDVSRHLWDESRHGHSGYSRLKDWGIDLHEVGFSPYNNDEVVKRMDEIEEGNPVPVAMPNPDLDFSAPGDPMSPKDLYEAVFFIGMIAENGHFIVKNESYEDFRDGQDLESAEMMLFDIIDETTHVQYAHKWLPELAEHAGIDNSDYRKRGSKIRAEMQEAEDKRTEQGKQLIKQSSPAWEHYENLLERIRSKYPLKGVDIQKERSRKPM